MILRHNNLYQKIKKILFSLSQTTFLVQAERSFSFDSTSLLTLFSCLWIGEETYAVYSWDPLTGLLAALAQLGCFRKLIQRLACPRELLLPVPKYFRLYHNLPICTNFVFPSFGRRIDALQFYQLQKLYPRQQRRRAAVLPVLLETSMRLVRNIWLVSRYEKYYESSCNAEAITRNYRFPTRQRFRTDPYTYVYILASCLSLCHQRTVKRDLLRSKLVIVMSG